MIFYLYPEILLRLLLSHNDRLPLMKRMNKPNIRFRIWHKVISKYYAKKTFGSYLEASRRCTGGLYENISIINLVKEKAGKLKDNLLDSGSEVNVHIGVLSLIDAIYRIYQAADKKSVGVIWVEV